MSFVKLIGIDKQEIEFEENKNSVKEIKLQCIAIHERRIKIKVKTTDPDVFQVVGKPIVFTELNQKEVLMIKANSAKKRDNDKDKIRIEAFEYEDSLPQSAYDLKPPTIQEIILTVRVLSNKTTQQGNDQKILESQNICDRQIDQIVESKFINQTSKFGDAQKFLSSNTKFDNVIEKQKSEFLSMYYKFQQYTQFLIYLKLLIFVLFIYSHIQLTYQLINSYYLSKIESSQVEQQVNFVLGQYQQKSQINASNILIETQPQYKQEYEQYLILTDEQEKELFKLSELKNKLQRQKLKQQQIVETPKPKALNTLHIGYAIIVVILSFMIGMLAKT